MISVRNRENQVSKPIGAYLNKIDLQILKTVYMWKVIPPSILKTMLLPNEKDNNFSQRKLRLVKRNCLGQILLAGKLPLLQLGSDGLSRLKHEVDGIKEDGSASEAPWHDFLVVALQLGLWAAAKPKNIDFVTEQQMRRFNQTQLPRWIPDCSIHRPDGYTRFRERNRSSLIAYEVEISRKNMERYDSVCQFYAHAQDVTRVIWLVRDKSIMELIERRAALLSHGSSKHSFILLDDFKDQFWKAKFVSGQEPGLDLVKLMSSLCHLDIESLSSACHDTLVSDFRKKLLSC